ncbi:PstS family phosphate ABC transporter substrate-binding protein [Candidatus Methanoperedens nitratireducens]|nr:PstS family phosphate ABC transporter substrate-binding protein [Candidatus Methanoperedens nitroreducens]
MISMIILIVFIVVVTYINPSDIMVGKSKYVLPLFLILVLMTGCIDRTTEQAVQSQELTGELKLDGSTTVFPIADRAARTFMKNHPQVKITVQQSSTGEGLDRFLRGESDISDATRPPKDSEYSTARSRGMELYMTLISYDAVAVIVHPKNPVSDLTLSQLKAIYFDGDITDWSQLTDKKTGKINIYNTDAKISGTAELFNKVVTGNDETPYVAGTTSIHPTPLMIPAIMNDPNGIAFTPMNWINSSVKTVKIDGITPKKEAVIDTSYPLGRKMYMITNGAPKGLTKEYINFVLSRDGQRIVEEEGFISII